MTASEPPLFPRAEDRADDEDAEPPEGAPAEHRPYDQDAEQDGPARPSPEPPRRPSPEPPRRPEPPPPERKPWERPPEQPRPPERKPWERPTAAPPTPTPTPSPPTSPPTPTPSPSSPPPWRREQRDEPRPRAGPEVPTRPLPSLPPRPTLEPRPSPPVTPAPPTREERLPALPTEPIKPAPAPEKAPEPAPESAPEVDLLLPGRGRGAVTRRLVQISPRSVFRLSLAFYLALLVAVIVGGTILWFFLQAAGVIGNLESFMGELLGYEDFEFLFGRILLVGILIGLVWVVLSAVVTALLALLYNRASKVAGGIRVVVDDGD